MKQIFLFLMLTIVFAGCKNVPETYKSTLAAPDISDLSMTDYLKNVYSERRQKLLEKAGNGVIILNSDYGFTGGRSEFRVANNFYYLTGFTEPGSLMVLKKEGSYPFSMYLTEKTISESVYTGDLPGAYEIMKTYLADTVLNYPDIGKVIESCIMSKTPIFIDYDDPMMQGNIVDAASNKAVAANLIHDISPVIYEMRVIKDDREVAMLQKAIDITGDAFVDVCRSCKPGMYEFEMEALIEYTFRKNGSSMPAFQSIVGSGPNSVVLHYAANSMKMGDGELLLMDIGAEYGRYCGDISRTIPVNGKFTEEQKDIYELILGSQKAAIAEMTGGKNLQAGHNKSTKIIVRGLFERGLITDTASDWQKKFYIHYPISHYLGMNVHDMGEYGTTFPELMEYIVKDTTLGRTLEKGMVLTVEPGLYFRSNGISQLFELFGKEASKQEIQEFIDKVNPVYEKYKNIGIRIEDDVLITDNGNIVLSKDIPKEVDEIEKLMER
jgi:Xaa-Pro aminopeptidase